MHLDAILQKVKIKINETIDTDTDIMDIDWQRNVQINDF